MDIALVTAAYNGYGRFADQWLGFIAESSVLPAKVIIALGPKHGLKNHEKLFAKYPQLNLQFHFCEKTEPLMGPMRNQAVSEAETEWVQYLSIDDQLLPEAIEEYARLEKDADFICISWQSKAQWKKEAPVVFHQGKTPETLAKKYDTRGFINAQSPYRRRFWLMEGYMNHDYPNAPFTASCIKNGARFVHTDVPCTRYLQRLNSHAKRLGRRGVRFQVKSEKIQANYWKNFLKKTMREYYL